jgi:hypothetical protein
MSLAASHSEDLIPLASDSLRFPGGEWLLRESWRAAPGHAAALPRPRHFLHYQGAAHAPHEALGEISPQDAGAPALREARPLLLRGPGRCALVLGRYVFQRWERPQGPWWHRITTRPFGAAVFFLRACLREHQPAESLRLPELPYAFGHLDLERNVLVTSREQPDRRFPQYLVYSAPLWGEPWRFDAERTRRVNGMPCEDGVGGED